MYVRSDQLFRRCLVDFYAQSKAFENHFAFELHATMFSNVKKIFQWTGHTCLKVFRNWTSSLRQKRKYSVYESSLALSQARGSISTEITILDDISYEIMEQKYQQKHRKRSF